MERIALTNGRVVDGTGRPEHAGGTILVEGSVIGAVGSDVPVPDGCPVVDLRGRTVLPGLIDGHMHVTGMPGLLDAKARLRGQLEASELLRECLQRGTTTVGHASGCEENLVLRDLIDEGALPGRARLLVSGVVTATGGHVRGAPSSLPPLGAGDLRANRGARPSGLPRHPPCRRPPRRLGSATEQLARDGAG